MRTFRRKKTKCSNLTIINSALFTVFLLNVVIFPYDNYNLKIASLILLLFINFPYILKEQTHKDEKIIIFFGLIITTVTIVWSIALTKDTRNIKIGYPGYILLLYFVIKKYDINILRRLVYILYGVAIFVDIMALLDLTEICDMYDNFLLMYWHQSENAMVGKSDDLPLKYMIFIKTSPLYFVALFHSMKKKNWFMTIVVFFAIALSGTRANIIMLLLAVVMYFCFLYPDKSIRKLFICIALLCGLIIIIEGSLIDYFVDMFVRKASSDAVRDGHLAGLFEYWKNNPLNLLVGSGYSSEFYSYGIEAYTTNIELSYWNLLRQTGLILFVPIMFAYLYPLIGLIKRKHELHMVLAYVIYLVIAYTNPFLYSSTGVCVLLTMYYIYFGMSKNNNYIERRTYERNYTCGRKRNAAVPAYKSDKQTVIARIR